jgi:hypothetical protein
MNEGEEKEPRKRPGRPRKKPTRERGHHNGIMAQPTNPAYVVEMTYDDPLLLKRMFALMKSMEASEIRMEFTPGSVSIYSSDHLVRNHCLVKFDATQLTYYYCAADTSVNLPLSNIEKAILMLDKPHTSVSFIVKAATRNSIITTVFTNANGISEFKDFETVEITGPPAAAAVSYEFADYPVQMSMPSKTLKKLVNDIGAFSGEFKVEHIGGQSLVFPFKSGKGVSGRNVIPLERAKAEYQFVTTLTKPSEMCVSGVNIDYVRPISSAIIAEEIRIAVHSTQNMILSAKVDCVELFFNIDVIRSHKG